jgi:hypothetical protein
VVFDYGFRVGIFEDMKIGLNGNWNSASKETVMNGKLSMSEVKKINEPGLLGCSTFDRLADFHADRKTQRSVPKEAR